jgi:hypothetical protein
VAHVGRGAGDDEPLAVDSFEFHLPCCSRRRRGGRWPSRASGGCWRPSRGAVPLLAI